MDNGNDLTVEHLGAGLEPSATVDRGTVRLQSLGD